MYKQFEFRADVRRNNYKPISNYGIIGDQSTTALVGVDGSIDWCCMPEFDSPSVFASLLDWKEGGHWSIEPATDYRSTQKYMTDTNILVTTFHTKSGSAEVCDFMPRLPDSELSSVEQIHRRVVGLEGDVPMRMVFKPRPDFSRSKAILARKERGCCVDSGRIHMSLSTTLDFEIIDDSLASSSFTLTKGNVDWAVCTYGSTEPRSVQELRCDESLTKTLGFWTEWVKGLRFEGPWREAVIRSALVLKLLTFRGTNAIVAAPTTSLPEVIGGSRNWDYRYSWVRDSCFSLWAFKLLENDSKEATGYLDWLMGICRTSVAQGLGHSLKIMYGIRGEISLEETEVHNLEGYCGSRPVRIGNGAHEQFQLDVYGETLDALYFSQRHIEKISPDHYEHLVKARADFICDNWTRPDNGIWEIRGGLRNFVYSKMWCYVGLKRAAHIARVMGHPEDSVRWRDVAVKIKKDILAKGWSSRKNAFVQSYGSEDLDAANLLMPLVKFLPPDDPRVVSTVERTMTELGRDCFVYRYLSSDNLKGSECAFTMCSFWVVDCLTAMGKIEEAKERFEKLLSLSNHLYLFSEEFDPLTKEMRGNFPQAFTHMSFIDTAVSLARALEERSK